jgi:peptidoglycan/xylan/chitin deacetylase (PgdA/CDA1 family)
MTYLVANEVRSTLFPTGWQLESPYHDEGRQVFTLAGQRDDLFDVGNHSYNHPDFDKISDAEIIEELRLTEDVIIEIVGKDPRPWFRPPSGAWNQHVLDVIGPLGYTYTIMWDVDTIDWRPPEQGGPSAQDIINKVLNNVQGGSIVLMHFGGWNTYDALPTIVETLRARGYELVTVAELLGVD